MTTIKKGVFRVRDESGVYVAHHLQTSVDQVLLEDGTNLKQKLAEIKTPDLATPITNGLMSSSDKVKLDQLSKEEIDLLEQALLVVSNKVNTLQQAPRIYHQAEEPVDAENGTIWIVGE